MKNIINHFQKAITSYCELKAYPLPRVKALLARRLVDLGDCHFDSELHGGGHPSTMREKLAYKAAQLRALESLIVSDFDAIVEPMWQRAIDCIEFDRGDTPEANALAFMADEYVAWIVGHEADGGAD